MPRRNKRKTEPHHHAPSAFDRGYKPECSGCAFAGYASVCLTSDGNCLKSPPPNPPNTKGVDNATIVGGTNSTGTKH